MNKKTGSKTKKNSKENNKQNMQTHAKEERFQPTTLDQIWGDNGNTKYGTTDLEVYINKISDMNKSDLQTHANLIGLVPVDDREILTRKLVSEFKKYVSGFTRPLSSPKAPPFVSKEVARILAEGK